MSPLISDQPFDDADYEALDEFLMSDDSPEESMMLPDLHGFLTAVITGPTVMPSEWLPVVWGGDQPVFRSIAQARKIMTLLLRLNNDIAAFLLEDPNNFEPYFMENRTVDPPVTIVDDWCYGYWRGVELRRDDWLWCETHAIIKEPLGFIRFVAKASNDEFDEYCRDPIKYDALVESIEIAPALIYHAWRTRESASKPVKRSQPKIPRNATCPCGSGKKFKLCCGVSL